MQVVVPCRWLGLPASLRKLEVDSTRRKVSLICHLLIDERGKAQRSNPPFALDDLTLWLSKIPTVHRATDQPGNSARMLKLYCSGSLLLCLVFLFLHLIHPIPGPKPTNQPTGRPAPSASFPTRLLRYIHLPYTSFLLSYPLSSHSYTSTYIPILISLRSSFFLGCPSHAVTPTHLLIHTLRSVLIHHSIVGHLHPHTPPLFSAADCLSHHHRAPIDPIVYPSFPLIIKDPQPS